MSPYDPPAASMTYGPDPFQTVEVFPAQAPGAPLAVLVHGGGFLSSAGDALRLDREAKALARQGVTAAVVNYRSDAQGPAFPMEVNDVVDGTLLAVTHAGSYNANPARLMLIGGSSGGTLVANAAVHLAATAKAVVLLSATTDIAAALSYWGSQRGPLAKLHVSHIQAALGGQSAASVSPVNLVNAGANGGQRWIVCASQAEEPIVRTMQNEMVNALARAGVPVSGLLVGGKGHSFAYWGEVAGNVAAAARAIP